MAKSMTLGDLIDRLANLSNKRLPIPLSDWRSLEIVVRGSDSNGDDFCGSLRDVSIEQSCDGESTFIALDASNEPENE